MSQRVFKLFNHCKRFCCDTYQCKTCNEYLPSSRFYTNPHYRLGLNTSMCKTCRQEYSHQFRCTKHGFFGRLINNAKHAQRRRHHAKGSDAPEFLLDSTYLDELCHRHNQKGYYSHLPLSFRPLSDWQASLETLDPWIQRLHT